MASLALRSQKTLWPDESEGESHILYMRPTPEKCTILAIADSHDQLDSIIDLFW